MKRAGKIVLVVLAVLVILVGILLLRLGPTVKTAVNGLGPAMLGVPVSVEDVNINPLSGKMRLTKLAIGNPEGFSTPHLFRLESLDVDLKMREIMGGKIGIQSIVINGPHVWYERKLRDSNVGKLLEMLEAQAAEPEPDEEKSEKEAKPVVIDRLLVKEGHIGLKVGIGGELPLPSIELKDIGKDDPDGLSPVEAVRRVMTAILGSITKVVAAAGDLALDGAKAVGKGVVEGGKLVGDGLGAGGKLVGDGLGAGGKLVGDGLGAGGKLVGEGAEAVGEQAGKAVKAVGGALKGVGGLLGGGGKSEDAEVRDEE